MDDQERYEKLSAFLTENKRALFDRIAPLRTRHVTVVLEDIHQSQNASAVVRTCDLLGIQDVHVIENRNTYRLNPAVALGSSKWIDLYRYRGHTDNTAHCTAALRAAGYRLVATTPHRAAATPETIALGRPMAFLFGTELTGLSRELLDAADEHLRIPMHGFTESYNLSVSAAIVLYTVMRRLRDSGIPIALETAEQASLKLRWARRVVRGAHALEDRLWLREEEDRGTPG